MSSGFEVPGQITLLMETWVPGKGRLAVRYVISAYGAMLPSEEIVLLETKSAYRAIQHKLTEVEQGHET